LPLYQTLWKSGEDGYHTYRIPALVTTTSGTLLAVCEGRKNSHSDQGEIHLLAKRSEDQGKNWTPAEVVWRDGENTCGNPCLLVDQDTGTIWLFATHNRGSDRQPAIRAGKSQGTRTCWVLSSTDDGRTWSSPQDITATTKKPQWSWYATGPGVGVQLRLGEHRGRLLVPCDHSERKKQGTFSHVIYSDDHGRTWQLGGRVEKPLYNECQLVELTDGRLMLNMRNELDKKNHDPNLHRAIAFSSDGGKSWTEATPDRSLPEPGCQSSLIRCLPATESQRPWLLHSNPADHLERKRLTVRLSKDDGYSWVASRVLFQKDAAYSCLAMLSNDTAACLFEADKSQRLVFATFTFDWLADTSP
jgi:sialidase-1